MKYVIFRADNLLKSDITYLKKCAQEAAQYSIHCDKKEVQIQESHVSVYAK